MLNLETEHRIDKKVVSHAAFKPIDESRAEIFFFLYQAFYTSSLKASQVIKRQIAAFDFLVILELE